MRVADRMHAEFEKGLRLAAMRGAAKGHEVAFAAAFARNRMRLRTNYRLDRFGVPELDDRGRLLREGGGR